MVSIFPVRMESGSRHGVLRLLITRVTCSNITMETNSLSNPDRLAPLLALLVWKKKKIHQTLFKCYHIDFWCDAFIGLSMYALSLFNSFLHDAIFYKLNFFILMRYVLLLDFSFLSMNISTLCFDYNLVYCIFILFTYCIMVCLSVGEAGWDL